MFNTDQELHDAATNFSAQHNVSYPTALRAAVIEQRLGMNANQARLAFSEEHALSEQEMSDWAELESIRKGISFGEALQGVISQKAHTPGAKRFFDALHRGVTPGDADMNDAAQQLSQESGLSFCEAFSKIDEVSKVADVIKVLPIAFSEGGEINDHLLNAAALMQAARTGSSYEVSLNHVLNTLPMSADANFAEAVAAAEPQQGIELEIFRAGNHTDSAGNKHSFTVKDVQAMAAAYDRTKREAPMVKGHPDEGAPAYGWIASLRATEDGRLMARTTQWDEGFLKEMKAGRYKKRSASFYPPGHSNNPVPGAFYLRHLGWLGAQQPAVGGLADVAFQATDEFLSFTL